MKEFEEYQKAEKELDEAKKNKKFYLEKLLNPIHEILEIITEEKENLDLPSSYNRSFKFLNSLPGSTDNGDFRDSLPINHLWNIELREGDNLFIKVYPEEEYPRMPTDPESMIYIYEMPMKLHVELVNSTYDKKVELIKKYLEAKKEEYFTEYQTKTETEVKNVLNQVNLDDPVILSELEKQIKAKKKF
jgi:hypothetical protein